MDEGLDRFKQAQGGGEYEDALAEIRAGAKHGHWIWYVFPQLRGLGRSELAERFGLDGEIEAEDYLADPLLRARLLEVSEADRAITYQLYGGDANTRIQQEIVLGIGGVRALRAVVEAVRPGDAASSPA